MQNNIDTDIIIPMHRYVMAEKSEIHHYAFEHLRYFSDGTKRPDFILNKTHYEESKILVVGHNFGCGSSREAAVWAISGLGIKCIIGLSFGTIFANNCFENGILVITLPTDELVSLAKAAQFNHEACEFKVSLKQNTICSSEKQLWNFKVPDHRRSQLLAGLDSIGMTMKKTNNIDEFQKLDKLCRPWVYININ